MNLCKNICIIMCLILSAGQPAHARTFRQQLRILFEPHVSRQYSCRVKIRTIAQRPDRAGKITGTVEGAMQIRCTVNEIFQDGSSEIAVEMLSGSLVSSVSRKKQEIAYLENIIGKKLYIVMDARGAILRTHGWEELLEQDSSEILKARYGKCEAQLPEGPIGIGEMWETASRLVFPLMKRIVNANVASSNVIIKRQRKGADGRLIVRSSFKADAESWTLKQKTEPDFDIMVKAQGEGRFTLSSLDCWIQEARLNFVINSVITPRSQEPTQSEEVEYEVTILIN